MKLHLLEYIDGPKWVAIVGAASTAPHWSKTIAILRGWRLEAAIGAAHVRRIIQ